MRERVRDRTEPVRPRREAEPPAHELLALQRRMGNQAVARLLARKELPPTRTPIAPVDELGSADDWKAKLAGGKREGYAEIATLLGARVITDVAGTTPEHVHLADGLNEAGLRPGLNFFHKLQDPGKCGYLTGGEFTAKLPVTRTGKPPPIAIVLGPNAFVAGNKARTLAVLRHELEHAAHNQLARAWLQRWRDDARTTLPFVAWIERQSIAKADLALVRERIDNTDVNTEALAHLEGFMAGFAVESAAAAVSSRRAYEELVAGATHAAHAADAIKQEFQARLIAFKARLPPDRRASLLARLQDLKRDAPGAAAIADEVRKR